MSQSPYREARRVFWIMDNGSSHRGLLADVEDRLLGFERYYESIATPFDWRFTRDDLTARLNKVMPTVDALPTAA
jgi:hypothetical protein